MVNILRCSLSPWRGDGELCRWCNTNAPRGGRNFCSRACAGEYYDNHVYGRGKQIVYEMAKGPCDCPDAMSPQGAYIDLSDMRVKYLRFKKPHVICNGCGECEEQIVARGDKLSINHIDPRNGIPGIEINCIHHMDNLEVLCWRDHEILNKLGNVRSRLDEYLAQAG